jgi:hypothetical protein
MAYRRLGVMPTLFGRELNDALEKLSRLKKKLSVLFSKKLKLGTA